MKKIVAIIIGLFAFDCLFLSGCIGHTSDLLGLESNESYDYAQLLEQDDEAFSDIEEFLNSNMPSIASNNEQLHHIASNDEIESSNDQIKVEDFETISFKDLNLPEYDGEMSVEVNGNNPLFERDEIGAPVFNERDLYNEEFLELSSLDKLGRTGSAIANAGIKLRPKVERESIGMIKPSGWNQNKYPEIIKESPSYLYNRCHLIAFSMCGNNDPENLITGTREFNAGNEGMLKWELKVLKYIDNNPKNHVLYRVTPIYDGNDLVAKGVLMEACSLEDDGLEFCVFVYNVQPGIFIDYETGKNHEE